VERDRTGPALAEYAELLYGPAILAEGGRFLDPAAFSGRIADLLLRVV
jgi:HSP90 family molecular chaperone